MLYQLLWLLLNTCFAASALSAGGPLWLVAITCAAWGVSLTCTIGTAYIYRSR